MLDEVPKANGDDEGTFDEKGLVTAAKVLDVANVEGAVVIVDPKGPDVATQEFVDGAGAKLVGG